MRNWIRHHKKHIAVHTAILGGFLCYVFLLSGPLFGRYEAIRGESALCEIALPKETNNIRYSLDRFPVSSRSVELRGWAYIEGQGSEDSETYVVLASEENTYIFATSPVPTRYITMFDNETGLNLDLDWAGFEAIIPLKKIERGDYVVGFYIKKDDIEALEYTDEVLAKSRDGVEIRTQTPGDQGHSDVSPTD
jgi:hypothetical protein